MEYKYIILGVFVSIVIFISFTVASIKSEQIASDPIISFFNIEAKSIFGETIKMDKYRGKKILIVNVASKCGLTPQYSELQELYKTYSDSLVVLAFPSNDFLRQEPGSNEQIAKFCSTEYFTTFPLFEKVKVKGKNKHSIYDWLTDPEKNGWNSKGPTWNFTKYLIDENGKLLKRFSPKTLPLSKDIISLIK
tara:strand:- start:854 stop:1429 length:576 start_codon:yes stop_codon:yes gene_type:complete